MNHISTYKSYNEGIIKDILSWPRKVVDHIQGNIKTREEEKQAICFKDLFDFILFQ